MSSAHLPLCFRLKFIGILQREMQLKVIIYKDAFDQPIQLQSQNLGCEYGVHHVKVLIEKKYLNSIIYYRYEFKNKQNTLREDRKRQFFFSQNTFIHIDCWEIQNFEITFQPNQNFNDVRILFHQINEDNLFDQQIILLDENFQHSIRLSTYQVQLTFLYQIETQCYLEASFRLNIFNFYCDGNKLFLNFSFDEIQDLKNHLKGLHSQKYDLLLEQKCQTWKLFFDDFRYRAEYLSEQDVVNLQMININKTGYEINIKKNQASLQQKNGELLKKIKYLGEEINNFPQNAKKVENNLKQKIEWVANNISKIQKIPIIETEELSLDSNQINEDLDSSYFPDPNKLNRQEKQLLTVSSRLSNVSLKSDCSLFKIDYDETTRQYQEMLKKKEKCIQDLDQTLKSYEEKVQQLLNKNKELQKQYKKGTEAQILQSSDETLKDLGLQITKEKENQTQKTQKFNYNIKEVQDLMDSMQNLREQINVLTLKNQQLIKQTQLTQEKLDKQEKQLKIYEEIFTIKKQSIGTQRYPNFKLQQNK